MDRACFEWDVKKNASNIRKHGISFEEAKSVFTDEYARLIGDPEHSEEEDRFILLGESIESRLLVVCQCVRDGDMIRLISARKADKQERKTYEGYRYA
jgi:uncharacterized DUF497 family protein